LFNSGIFFSRPGRALVLVSPAGFEPTAF